MAQGDIESGGGVLRDNDVVPLALACRTVAKAAAKLAMGPETNEAEIKVSHLASQPALCAVVATSWLAFNRRGEVTRALSHGRGRYGQCAHLVFTVQKGSSPHRSWSVSQVRLDPVQNAQYRYNPFCIR